MVTLTDEQLKDLEAKAKAAKRGKRKSEWEWDGREVEADGYVHIPQGATLVGLVQLGDTYEGYQDDCDFIQAASPWVVLALVEELKQLRAEKRRQTFIDVAFREAERRRQEWHAKVDAGMPRCQHGNEGGPCMEAPEENGWCLRHQHIQQHIQRIHERFARGGP